MYCKINRLVGHRLINRDGLSVKQNSVAWLERDLCLREKRCRITLLSLQRDDLIVVDDMDNGDCFGLAGGEKKYCNGQQADKSHKSNYTLPDFMHDPYVRLDVDSLVFLRIHLD